MNIIWKGPLPGTNYTSKRGGKTVTRIVDHWIGSGTAEGADAHFHNPNAGTSAHYIVTQQGEIWQWVAEEDTAHHAGNWTANLESIGIEHEATPTLVATPALYAASAMLHRDIADRYGILLAVGTTVLPHGDITPTQCPGTLNIRAIVEAAMSYVTREEFDNYKNDVRSTIDAMKKAYDPLVHHKHDAETEGPKGGTG